MYHCHAEHIQLRLFTEEKNKTYVPFGIDESSKHTFIIYRVVYIYINNSAFKKLKNEANTEKEHISVKTHHYVHEQIPMEFP